MLTGLRARLFISYLLMILVTLLVIGVALFVVLQTPDGTDWLFVGQNPQPESTSPFISVAIRAPRLLNAAETIQYYAQDLVTPLLEAGLIGLAAAFLMSLMITRSVARPLQDVAR